MYLKSICLSLFGALCFRWCSGLSFVHGVVTARKVFQSVACTQWIRLRPFMEYFREVRVQWGVMLPDGRGAELAEGSIPNPGLS
jgi:hypothetical protein